MEDPAREMEIQLNWNDSITPISFDYATNKDFSNKKSIELDGTTHVVFLRNLFKNTVYYICIVGINKERKKEIYSSEFKTTDLGPRTIMADGVYNIRDLGGYKVGSKYTKQGLIFRGGALSPSTNQYGQISISELGKKILSEDLKIKSDLDLRSASENFDLQISPIPNASLTYCDIGGGWRGC